MNKEKALEKLSALEKEAEELRKIIESPAEQTPWVPSSGKYYLSPFSLDVDTSETSFTNYRDACLEYHTFEAATAASKLITFYRKLVKLASDVNPSGVPGGDFRVFMKSYSKQWETINDPAFSYPSMFETEKAAQKAADIMNRDGWEIPNYNRDDKTN